MSRRYDRTQREYQRASEILKGSIRRKPWWVPAYIWRPIHLLAAKIVFR